MTAWTGSAVLVLQCPDLQQLEQCRRTPGHERHHLLEAGPLDLAGAALGVGRALEAGDHLEVGLVLAGGISLGVAAAGFGTVAEGLSLWLSPSFSSTESRSPAPRPTASPMVPLIANYPSKISHYLAQQY